MSALGQKRTSPLFDYFVGTAKQRHWNGESHGHGGLEIDYEIELRRRLHRQVSGLLAFENAINVSGGALK
jgi:hypothetical protein